MSNPLVLLKSGATMPPVFITHGLGGDLMELTELVKHIESHHPIYGLQAKGLDGFEPPSERIEDMAQYYIEKIVELQPHGPYFLAGLSFGGLPMLEVAHRLSEKGEQIALLALLDTYPHPQYWPLRSWMNVLIRRAGHHVSALSEMPPHHAIHYLIKLSNGFLDRVRSRLGASPGPGNPDFLTAVQRMRKAAMVAWTNYSPRYYSGNITFIKVESATSFPDDPVKVWGQFFRRLVVFEVPGDHVGMITEHAAAVANQISLCLKRAIGAEPVTNGID